MSDYLTPEEAKKVIEQARGEAIKLLSQVNENARWSQLQEYSEKLQDMGIDPASPRFNSLMVEYLGKIIHETGPGDESIKAIRQQATQEQAATPPTSPQPEQPAPLSELEKSGRIVSQDRLWKSIKAEEKIAKQNKQNGKGK